MATNFSTYASRMLGSFVPQDPFDDPVPLFYSTTSFQVGISHADDILGSSGESTSHQHFNHGARSYQSHDEDPLGNQEDEEEVERKQEPSRLASFPSRLYERSTANLSRGWKAYESKSVLPDRERYSYDQDDTEGMHEDLLEEDDEEGSPPSFLSPFEATTVEPLLPPSTLYVYPASPRAIGIASASQYRDSPWLLPFFGALIASVIVGIREWWIVKQPIILPTVPILSLLSLLSAVAGISCIAYLLAVKSAVRSVVYGALIGTPAVMVFVGLVALVGSLGEGGVENDSGWKLGVRCFAGLSFVAAYFLAQYGLRNRKKITRSIKVLELASSIILDHPPLLMLSLAISLLSTVITLPFLLLLSSLLARNPTAYFPGWIPVGTLLTYFWTLAVLRGLQKVTIAGVVGSWYFERHEPNYLSPYENTRAAFNRASGPSLGTIICSSFIVAIFETLGYLARQVRRTIRSSALPSFLHPLTYLTPVLALVTSAFEMYTGYILSMVGLTGQGFKASAEQIRNLLSRNGTRGLGENLLVKFVLFLVAFSWALITGLVAFLATSSRIGDPRLAPWIAALCFAVPFWTLRLCASIVADSADACFLCFNYDQQKGTAHCTKAEEAFGDLDDRNTLP